jgi:formiminotetrahydrofolate cyclodeaminase
MLESITEGTILIIVGTIVAGLTGYVASLFRAKKEKEEKLEQQIEDLCKRLYRFEKAFIILVKMQEDAIEKSHPELQTDWEDVVKELLRGQHYDV